MSTRWRDLLYTALASTACALLVLGLNSDRYSFPVWRAPPDTFVWRHVEQHYPLTSFRPLPTEEPKALPAVQAKFPTESSEAQEIRLQRRDAVKATFLKSWTTYRDHAWLHDEVGPVSGEAKDPFGGWGATLIDSLDTLWIMDLKDEFYSAVDAVHQNISFETTTAIVISTFETSIRFLGGLLSAYDLSGDKRLLSKARDVGDMLYKAFDTPERMPIPKWNFNAALEGVVQSSPGSLLLAELGSYSLDFTHLSLLTKDPKYYEIVARITDLLHETQMSTKVPGLWPTKVGLTAQNLDAGSDYTFGAEADSAFEYTAKMIALLGGQVPQYEEMYSRSIGAAVRHLFYRPLTPENEDILVSGTVRNPAGSGPQTDTTAQHLSCFAGGMLALGGRLTNNETHVELGRKLTDGCIWLYRSLPIGLMPEACTITACPDPASCDWSKDINVWHDAVRYKYGSSRPVEDIIADNRLPPGWVNIYAPYYILRPEAIESIFVLYRVTGDASLMDRAWEMWTAVTGATATELANSAIDDVNPPAGQPLKMSDSMESFWLSETLKYFYLVFSEPGLVSLDEWVFNTEAHPFRRDV
ncbi:glycoside hydrolase family 47 protein [Coniochaeta ligniaria NRRL 30616]|uniref:alpha-1,2-Mannosidase n=1 Tax=Coniochaeta ligniaria NRRL 30616 TaxID=1408157 RepID=A0A1J7IUD8_9PEZI|nr:glycoside hydrolase family 47 protein [Coniochaeta ligniaria NRRL 30616]